MYDEKTRKYDAYVDALQYKFVEGIEQGRSEERENSIARFIKYVKLGVISKKDACLDLGMTEKELDKYLQTQQLKIVVETNRITKIIYNN